MDCDFADHFNRNYLSGLIAIGIALILLSVVLYVFPYGFVSFLLPDGLKNHADVCNHDWYVIDESVGLYNGYNVYCPACGDTRTCCVSEYNQYKADKDYGRTGE